MPQGWTLVQPAPEGWKPVSTQPEAAPRKPAATEDYLPPETSWMDSATNFVKNFAHNVDPRPALEALYDVQKGILGGDLDALTRTTDRAKALGGAQLEQFKKAKRDYDAGRYSEAIGHTMAGALPLLGPAAATAGEQIGTGDVAGGMGGAAGLLTPFGAKYGVEAARTGSLLPTPAKVAALKPAALPVTRGTQPTHQADVAANDFAIQEGIPRDAATATGSQLIATLQKATGDSIGGAGTAERFKAGQQARLATVGEQLAAKANTQPGGQPGRPMTQQTAGEGALAAVDGHVAAETATADAAYSRLRKIEEAKPIPVNLSAEKPALEQLYRTMAIGGDIAPIQGKKGAVVRALARILEGPDVAGISEVDSALSDLKSLARDAADTPGAAAANQAVAAVHRAVMNAAAKAGPDAVKALNEGRAATTRKYAAVEVRDFLAGNTNEPVQAFRRVVERDDSNIRRVEKLAALIPEEMPNIGRAFLDDAMATAKSDRGFQHAAKLAANWEKLGPETKKLMFRNPGHVAALDNFFRVAEKMTENVNPSGSGKVINVAKNFWNPLQLLSAVPTWGLSKLLYTERGVKLLTQGFSVPLQSPAAAAQYSARLSAAIKDAGVMQPAMAGDSQEPTPTTIGRR